MILSFSFIQFIRVFLQTDFFQQLLIFFESFALPPALSSPLEAFIQQLILFLSSALMIFPKLFTFLSLTCLIAFLLLLQPHQLDPYFNQLSLSFQQKILHVHTSLILTLKKMSLSALLLMGMTWIECWIGLLLIHEPHAFSLSLLIACFDSLPLFGVGVVLLPLSLSQFFFGFPKRAVGLLLIYLIVTSLRFLIEPKLFAHQMGIPVLVHLLSMIICLNLFGALGFFYAPFLCVLGMDMLHNRQQRTQTTTKELNL